MNEKPLSTVFHVQTNSRHLRSLLNLPEVPPPHLSTDPCVLGRFSAQRKSQFGCVENSADVLSADRPSPPPPTGVPQTWQRNERGTVQTVLSATANSAGVWAAQCSKRN